ncbi:YwaF family protein [Helicovermis profundi]|uniref:YwaF family protein n=1 Tax=Helicovermis profundi TaxID=3065157 RepID=UPI003BB0A319
MNPSLFINIFHLYKNNYVDFQLFSFYHKISLMLIATILVFMFIFKKYIKYPKLTLIIRLILLLIMILQFITLYAWIFKTNSFSFSDSLPIYLCRLTSLFCIFMLLFKSYKLFEVLYFWGFAGVPFALLTPDTFGQTFPNIIYIRFFVSHGAILISLLFMIIAYDFYPTFNSLKKTIKYSLLYLIVCYIINTIFNGNYSYLSQKPYTSSVLDVLPSFPFYIPLMIIIIFSIFALLFIPFFLYSKKH